MNKIKWKNVYADYAGYVVRDNINKVYIWQNSNDLGYLNDIADIENESVRVLKVFKYKDLKILEIENQYEYEAQEYDCAETTLDKALQEIAECYGK